MDAIEIEARLETAVDPKERVDLANALALALRFDDLARAIALSEQAAQWSDQGEFEKQPYHQGKTESFYQLGLFHIQRGDYPQAQSYLFKALLAAEVIGDQKQSALVLYSLGLAYAHLGDYPNALDHFLRVHDLSEELGDRQIEAQALNSIGSLYVQLNNWSKALAYLLQSLEISRDLGDKRLQAGALDNCCNCYCHLGDYERALSCGLQSLQLYREIGARQGEAEVLNSLGEVYQAQNDYPQALSCFQKSLDVAREIGLKSEAVCALLSMSDIYARGRDTSQALASLHQALEIAQEIQSKREIFLCHQSLASLYRQSGDFEQALAHYEQFHAAKEAIFNEEADHRLRNLEAGFRLEAAQKEAKIYQLKNVALQQEISERQQIEEALKAANVLLQLEISERERLIADLNAYSHMVAHDLKTPLSAINGYCFLLAKKLASTTDIEVLRYIEIIDQTCARMNRIVEELLLLSSVRQQDVVPVPLDMGSIVGEVENRLQHMIIQYQAEIIRPGQWPPAMGYAQWVEEVWTNYISNAIIYGGTPPRVELGATRLNDGKIRFWVRDNGIGISPEDQPQLFSPFTRLDKTRAMGYGLGLSIVKRIMEKLGGEVGVESEGLPDRGSVFSFTLPATTSQSPIANRQS